MYKETVKDWSKEAVITLEQYLYVRNGFSGNRLNVSVSPYELRKFGIEKMSKGWITKYGKQEFPVTLAKQAATVGMNLKSQEERVKNRLYASFFLEGFDEQLLYLISSDSGLVKIGVSKSPKDRMKKLQTACGEKLSLLGCWKVKGKATIIEAKLHKMFEESRMLGEWFQHDIINLSDFENKIPCSFERLSL